ncbi:hydrogen gas-evolving membrane-bound hydrogenase subunit E [Pontibacter pamirensis]|uniref:hydrogen gas-evolving membrane-bound hydrogenase subunit E n=1 Tax=Pontibacter pamirensis TaxID=2562824 RepID=UPI00138A4C07|nr:hydrogen gas-evolving membrane-bound hydrogenase subunit E [Pontibacter pamirensis]
MFYTLLAGLLVAFAAPLLFRWLGRYVVLPLALLPLCIFIYFCAQVSQVLGGTRIIASTSWVPELGINLDFYLDGLSLLFALLISFFGFLIMIYAYGYLEKHPLLGRFYMYLTLFMTAMLGVVTADNIFCLFLFWELTSISSYLLIGFNNDQIESRTSAWQALLVTGGGGLALMGGLILLSLASGHFTFSGMVLSSNISLATHPLYLPALLLILLGCFTKSAQFPFHFWLPNAMAAPTPVSAYLHSATMVKAGIFLLARLSPVLGGTETWMTILLVVGGTTAVVGALLALQQTDLKAILAYTTISALGLLVMMLGIGSVLAIEAMLVFLLAHALYKGTLFLVAGVVDHSTGTRQVNDLKGLGRSMMYTGIAATLAALSMAGVISFFGFIGKELLYEASLESEVFNWLTLGVNMLAGLTFVAVAILMSYRLFWSKTSKPTALQHQTSPYLYLPPLVLGLLGLVFGLMAGLLPAPVLEKAALSILPSQKVQFELAIWHGFTPVLGLSMLTLVLGYLLYRFLPALHSAAPRLKKVYRYGPDSMYHTGFKSFQKGAKVFINTLQNGYLRNYIIYIVLFFCGLMLFALWRDAPHVNLGARRELLDQIELHELVLFVLVIAALFYILNTRSRLTSIVVMGLVGYSAALFYILYGAPDVAATQLLIETLTVVIFVLLLHKLPAFWYLSHQFRKYKFIAISILFGSVMTYTLLLVQEFAVESELKEFYGNASFLEAHGRNVVNVILVDFRGLDTLGEITVLAVAAVGIFALLRLNPEKGGKP